MKYLKYIKRDQQNYRLNFTKNQIIKMLICNLNNKNKFSFKINTQIFVSAL